MALPGNKNFSDYDNYVTDQNPTTSAQAQDYFRNQAELLKAVIDCDFWQPETVYQPGDVVKSDSMPNGTEAVMVATKASVTSNVEPSWGEVGGANISDGACFWKLRWQHWSKSVIPMENLGIEFAAQAQAEAGLDNTTVMTPKGVDYRLKKDRQIQTYTTLESIGLTNNCTLRDISNALPIVSVLEVGIASPLNGNIGLTNNGILTAQKNYNGSCYFTAQLALIPTRILTCEYYPWSDTLTAWKQIAHTVIGEIMMFSGGAEGISDFLPCNGAAISRETYADLFAVIGTKYGAGNGSTTFNVPNIVNGKIISGNTLEAKGNGLTLGLTDGVNNFGLMRSGYAPSGLQVNPAQITQSAYGVPVGHTATRASYVESDTVGITTDKTKSGIIVDLADQLTVHYYIRYQ